MPNPTRSVAPPDTDAHNDLVPWSPDDLNHSIVRRFEKVLPHCLDRLAASDADGSLTYRELNRRANRLAHALLAVPVTAGKPVALLIDHGVEGVVGLLGALKAGAIALPIDSSAPPERLKDILEESRARCLVTSAPLSTLKPLASASIPILSFADLPDNLPEHDPHIEVPPDSPAFLLFTSGSTGTPKGVIRTHRIALHRRMGAIGPTRLSPDDRVALLSSYSFAWSVGSITSAILSGAVACFYEAKRLGAAGLPDWIAQTRITVLPAVASLFRELAAALEPGRSFPHLRLITLGGETVLPSDLELFQSRFGDHTRLRVSLGLSEAGTIAALVLDKSSRIEGDLLPVGYVAPDIELLILDEKGNPLPPGNPGQIAVKGRYISPGYWRNPERTAQSFFPDPNDPGVQTYLTGDIGRLDPDGLLYHLGRVDSQVKVRGARVEIGEVENTLLKIPAVENAAVLSRPLAGALPAAAGEKLLVAYIKSRRSPPPTVSALRAQLRRSLPDYQIPSRFVFMDSLPLTLSGKVDRTALPDPDSVRPELDVPFLAPQTPLEQELADIWSRLLRLAPVGVNDSFFDLGGHSLLASQLVIAVLKSTGKNLPLATLLEAPTVRAMANILQSDTWSTPDASLVPLQPLGDKPPIFCLPGAGMDVLHFQPLAKALAPHHQPVYAFQARGMDGKLPPHASVEEMADDYIAELERLHPSGPVFLVGRCMGGFVAFEMARRLLAAGRSVPLVVLLDSSQPPPPITLRTYLRTLFTYQLPRGRFFFCLSRDL
ncbi:MAG: amino acid adenylation domain-containing protein, partial [Planctomycetota bacterium]